MQVLILRCILFFSFVLPVADASAQQRQLINGDYQGVSFHALVRSIEEQTDFRFFYKPVWTDSLRVTIYAANKPVPELLKEVFAGTDLRFAIHDKTIYITQSREILTSLPQGFYERLDKPKESTPAFDYSEYERREKQKKIAETKVYTFGDKNNPLQGTATVTGRIREVNTGEPVVGAAVFIESPMIGTATDQFGQYTLTLPRGRHEIKIKSVGMKGTVRNVMLYGNGKLDIELEEDIIPLKEVVIESERDIRVVGMQMGMEKLDIKTMKQMPLALGETDIMKVVLTLPGVQSVGEGTVGLNVRGGATNQNLILLNDAVVYNPSHLFGFFSTFNPDILKSVELYKSGMTADYGGRLSSVLDVRTREGSTKKFSGSGGISPITGRFTLEGPLIKDKTSFIVGVRSTYSNWLLRQLNDKALQRSKASFYDVTASVTHKINDNNSVYLSMYKSKDAFRLNNDTTYGYSDQNASLKWKHVFNARLYTVITSSYSNYRYDIASERNPVNAFTMDFDIRQWQGRIDATYFLDARHTLTAGISSTRYRLAPGDLQPRGAESLIVPDVIEPEHGLETAFYAGDQFEITPRLSVYAGIRYALYHYLGPKSVFRYLDGTSREPSSITDTLVFQRNKTISQYGGAEPRFSLRYIVGKNASVKVSYNRIYQYIQMLSNTTAINPTDIWKLSDPYIRPQMAEQVSVGLYKNFRGSVIETSVEAYYKTMEHATDFKSGAQLLLNHHLETDVIEAQGKAYGIEFLVKKSVGKVNGWVSYTYSRSLLRTVSEYSSETVNRGDWFPSNFDKPHAVNFIGNYKFSRRFNTSLNVIYSTGRPITLPIAKFEIDGTSRLFYSDRNQYRIPDYFRVDFSMNIEGNHKVRKLAHSSWTLAVYNLLGRDNPYSVFYVSENGKVKGYQLSIFARPIPTITYNFKF